MNNKKILDVLAAKYKLRPNLISVLNVLMTGKKYTYIELSKAANVPKTKVYELVNELNSIGLIDIIGESKGATLYYMSNVKKNILEFLKKQVEMSIEKYEEVTDILEEEEQIEEKMIINNSNQYVFGALRVITESDKIYVLSRRKSAPAIFYPREIEDYYKLRNFIAMTRETLTGIKELTRIMYEETFKAVEYNKQFTYIMTLSGLKFFLERYRECFGQKKTADFVLGLPEYLKENNHKIFVIDESNPMSLYITEKRMILVVTESGGEIAGIYTNKKMIIDTHMQMFSEMLERSKPIEFYLDRFVQ
jgi:sugar-specific transcriptional regulator TrmB